jgi:cytosine/adenosine deaminase-related metal-dependent hydrolase
MLRHVVDLGIDRTMALAAATLHPRRVGGFPQSSGVEVGERADLVLLDADLGVIEVIGS